MLRGGGATLPWVRGTQGAQRGYRGQGTAQASGGGGGSEAVAAQLARFDGSSGTVAVSQGWLLKPGALTATDIANGKVRVTVGGSEVSTYLEGIGRTRADGSYRAVLIQFDANVSSGGRSDVTVEVGTARTAGTLTGRSATTMPSVLLVPSSATYLVETRPLTHGMTTWTDRPNDSNYSQFHSDTVDLSATNSSGGLKEMLDRRWDGGPPGFFNSDAAWPYFYYWLRRSDATYLYRALQTVAPYAVGSDPLAGNEWEKWWRSPTLGYLLTGAVSYRSRLKGVADNWDFAPMSTATKFFNGSGAPYDTRWCAVGAGNALGAWLCGEGDTYKNSARTVYDFFVRAAGTQCTGAAGSSGNHYYRDAGNIQANGGAMKWYMEGIGLGFMVDFVESAETTLRGSFTTHLTAQLSRHADSRVTQGDGNRWFPYRYSPEGVAEGPTDGPLSLSGYLADVFMYAYAATSQTSWRDIADDLVRLTPIYNASQDGQAGGQAYFGGAHTTFWRKGSL